MPLDADGGDRSPAGDPSTGILVGMGNHGQVTNVGTGLRPSHAGFGPQERSVCVAALLVFDGAVMLGGLDRVFCTYLSGRSLYYLGTKQVYLAGQQTHKVPPSDLR